MVLLPVDSWENLLRLLFLEILCRWVFLALYEDMAHAGLQNSLWFFGRKACGG